MAITIKLDDLLHDRRMTLTELADRVGMTLANLSILKTGKARAIRFSTLNAICAALSCRRTRARLQQGEFQMKHPVRIGLTPKVHHAKFPPSDGFCPWGQRQTRRWPRQQRARSPRI